MASSSSPPSWLHRHAITLVAALLLSVYAPRAFAQVRVAVVDLQRAISETEDGRRAKRRLKRLFDERQAELERRQTELKQLSEDAQRPGLSEETRRARAESLQQKALELQQLYAQYQRELAEEEAEASAEIIERMQDILRRLGQSEGYTLILERGQGGVIFVPTNLDLTDVVIQRYEAGEGREGSRTTTDRASDPPAARPAERPDAGRPRRDAGP
ncbi:MAG: OmpH family outer membrane protein [Deltaproteobacteria bacterium]|nr:OmpH family outer membrane protein [Deltaproteobacteria bacterium]